MSHTDPFFLTGVILEDKYRVDHFVAEGGFGAVYAGHHLRLDVPLAIKVLKTNRLLSTEGRAEQVSRFLDEARTTARLAHPNITRAMDTGVIYTSEYPDGVPWLALEWLDGQTLEDELHERRGRGGRTPRETFELLGPVIDAIAYAHAAGVVHRDLKPSNVMLVRERGKVVARVLDFGIAKLAEGSFAPPSGKTTTESTMVAFSPGYAAPEQVSRARTGPWTDVHALGLLLTEMLTDELPYGAEEGIQVLSSILSNQRPTPERRGYIVGPWEAELARAVALNPKDRHKDAGELFHALSSSLDAAEVSSRSSIKPLSHRRTVEAVTSPASDSADGAKTDVGSPPRSTTLANTASVLSGNAARAPSTVSIVVGLGLTVVLVGVGLLALGSHRSAAALGPVPSARTNAPRVRAALDAGASVAAPRVSPTTSSSAEGFPPPSAAASAAAVAPRHGGTGVKPAHGQNSEAARAKERLAPTSSFE